MNKSGLITSKPHKISCSNVPQELLLKQSAKQYFSQFGKVNQILLRPKSKSCIIEYENETGVQWAIANGGEFNGKVFGISRYTKPSPKKRPVKKDKDPDWTVDPEVQEELAAMAGKSLLKKSYNLRPEKMVVDTPQLESPAKKKDKPKISKWKSGSPKPVQSSEASNERMELLKIVRQSAYTAEEKYKVLEARDKLIRICTRKHMDLSKAVRTVGTCPDMCPEKERLMREVQHQVAIYEQEIGGKAMNPALAVKQYSRSSADQEVPLPHELRPVSVLQMTMTYLMTKIMNLCDSPDVNLAEWYHFLWDRTRGIRKDITQQELCCQNSVQLVEQCARFHIHCSARLVAEDPSVFDQKINTENLTKCLQTLKYMYHDLELKEIHCKNEAEFRAYIILLNLNDGNFMWEVQQLKSEIQKSKEVNFALQVYSAIDKNNYVRFFNLVKSTTYLNACILLRYFVQVRLNALKTILKCYSPRAQTLYPLDELTTILAFENSESTADFVRYHGLQLNEEESHVVLDRRQFQLPEFPYMLERAVGVIESKKERSVGDVVRGNHSEVSIDFERHIPQDSFNVDGYLKDDLEELGVCQGEEPKAFAGDVVASNSSGFQSAGSIFGVSGGQNLQERSKSPVAVVEVESVESKEVKTGGVSIFSCKESFEVESSQDTNSIFGSKIFENYKTSKEETQKIETPVSIFTIPNESKMDELKRIEEEKKIEEAKEAQRQFERNEIIRKQTEKMERLKREEELRNLEIERERLKKIEENRKRKQEEQRILKEKIQLQKDVEYVVEELLEIVEKKHKERRLKEISEKLIKIKLSLFVRKWKDKAKNISRKRKAMDLSPSFVPSRTLQEEATELYTISQDLNLQMIKRYKYGRPKPIAAYEEQPIEKIDLHNLLYKTIITRLHELEVQFKNELFWKVTISVNPEIKCEKSLKTVEEILTDCFKLTSNKRLIEQKRGINQYITYCVELQDENEPSTDSNALIFIFQRLNHSSCKKIELQSTACGRNLPIPISVITQDTNLNTEKLEELLNEDLISDYKIQRDSFSVNSLRDMLSTSLQFLASKTEREPPLEVDDLKTFVHKYYASEMWKRISSLSKWNCNYRNCLKRPDVVVSLSNENLERIKKLVLNECRFGYPDFPEVFKPYLKELSYLPCSYRYLPEFWRNPGYNELLQEVLEKLTVPDYYYKWPPKCKKSLEEDVSDYCHKSFLNPEKAFYRLMSVILKTFNPDDDFGKVENVPWNEVVEMITIILVEEANYDMTGVFASKSAFKRLFVVYDTDELKEYLDNNWYYVNHPIVNVIIKQMIMNAEETAEEKVQDMINFDLDEFLQRMTEDRFAKNDEEKKKKEDVANLELLIKDLGESIDIQKKISERIQNALKTVVDL